MDRGRTHVEDSNSTELLDVGHKFDGEKLKDCIQPSNLAQKNARPLKDH